MTETTETAKMPMQNLPEQPQMLVEESGYEKEDVNARVIIIMFIIGTITIGMIMFLLSEYFTSRKEAQVQEANAVVSSTYRDVRAREEERLNSYKLVNEQNGLYQIPINEAMKALVNEAYERKIKASQTPPVVADAKSMKGAKKDVKNKLGKSEKK